MKLHGQPGATCAELIMMAIVSRDRGYNDWGWTAQYFRVVQCECGTSTQDMLAQDL